MAKKLSGKSRWLLPSEIGKSHMRGESIDHAVRRSHKIVFKEAKIKHFTPYDLRHTAATHMTEIGVSRPFMTAIVMTLRSVMR